MENATLTDPLRYQLIEALSSMQDEPNGWNAVAQGSILPEHVSRLDNSTVRITLHPLGSRYSIVSPETLTLVVPPELVASAQPLPAVFLHPPGVGHADAAGLRISPSAGNASLHGSFVSAATRADLRSAAEHVLSITLGAGEAWRPEVGLNDVECIFGDRACPTRDLLAGFTTRSGEASGWESVLGAALTYLDVLRIDDTTLHIRLGPMPAYSIAAPEFLALTVPSTALRSDASLTLTPPLTIAVNQTNGRPRLGGSFLLQSSLREDSVQREPPLELTISLVDDEWVPSLGADVVRALALGISAGSGGRQQAAEDVEEEALFGWVSIVQPALSPLNVTRVNDTVLSIVFHHGSYDLNDARPELLSVTVPPVAVISSVRQPAQPSLLVEPVTCTVALGGSLAAAVAAVGADGDLSASAYRLATADRGVQESALRHANGTTLLISLRGCTWRLGPSAPDGVWRLSAASVSALLGGIRSASDEPGGFNAVVLPTLYAVAGLANETASANGTALANATNSSAAVAAALAASAAVRVLNASAVLVSVPPLPLFDISRPEVITVAVAPSLLRFSSPPANRPRFEITAIPGTAVAIVDSERLAPRRPADELVEAAVQSRLNLLVFRLVGDTWSEGLGSDCVGDSVGGGGSSGGSGSGSATLALLSALLSAQHEPHGFNAVIRPTLSCANVVRNSSTVLTVLLPPFSTYDTTMPETIRVHLPSDAVHSGQRILSAPDIVLRNSPPQAVLGGAMITQAGLLTEGALVKPIHTQLVISLLGTTWLPPESWQNATNQQLIVDALRSATPELPSGWEAAVKPHILPENVRYVDGTTLIVELRQAATYALDAPETVHLSIPAAATRTLAAPLAVQPALVVAASGGVLSLNGSLLSSLDEASLGGELQIALHGDKWIEDEARLADLLRSAIRSAASEPLGFNAALAPRLDVSRRSRHLIEVQVPAAASAGYGIAAPETLLIAIPPSAVESQQGARANIDLCVVPTRGSAVLSDAATPGALYLYLDKNEALVRSQASFTLQLKLTGDAWSFDVGEATNASAALIDGFLSLQNEARGWNAIVRKTMGYSSLRRVDSSLLHVTVPQSGNYDIVAPETLVVSVPAIALRSRTVPALAAAGPARMLVINATQGSATLSGSLLQRASVADVRSPAVMSVQLNLVDVSFKEELLTSDAMMTMLARSLASRDGVSGAILSTEPFGWNAIVRQGLSSLSLASLTPTSVSVIVEQFAACTSAANEPVVA